LLRLELDPLRQAAAATRSSSISQVVACMARTRFDAGKPVVQISVFPQYLRTRRRLSQHRQVRRQQQIGEAKRVPRHPCGRR
jgi:hypothetical protein